MFVYSLSSFSFLFFIIYYVFICEDGRTNGTRLRISWKIAGARLEIKRQKYLSAVKILNALCVRPHWVLYYKISDTERERVIPNILRRLWLPCILKKNAWGEAARQQWWWGSVALVFSSFLLTFFFLFVLQKNKICCLKEWTLYRENDVCQTYCGFFMQ